LICCGIAIININITIILKLLQVKNEFSFSLFDLDWEVFSVNIEGAVNRVPAIEKTGIKSTVCGPGMSLHSVRLCLLNYIIKRTLENVQLTVGHSYCHSSSMQFP